MSSAAEIHAGAHQQMDKMGYPELSGRLRIMCNGDKVVRLLGQVELWYHKQLLITAVQSSVDDIEIDPSGIEVLSSDGPTRHYGDC